MSATTTVKARSLSPWALVALLSATATASYLARVNLSIVGALLMPAFGLDQSVMGRVFSAFLLGYAFTQIPGGLLADRWGPRRVLHAAAWLWAILTAVQALLGVIPGGTIPVLWLLIALRFTLGVSEAPTFPASARAIASAVPAAAAARANGCVLAAIGLGSALAPPMLSLTMVRFGWRAAICVSALPAMIVALLWRGVSDIVGCGSKDSRERVAETPIPVPPATDRAGTGFVFLTASYTLQGYVGYIFVFWFYLYLVQERHFDLLRGAAMSSLPWLLSIVSIPAGGWLSDRLVVRRLGHVWGRRAVPVAALSTAGACIAIGARASNAYLAATTLAIASAAVLAVEGPFWATMIELSGPRSGAAGGTMNMGSNLGGLISPALTPWIAARVGWERALDVAALLSVVAAGLWLMVSPPGPEERERATAVYNPGLAEGEGRS